ncbi:copper resistance D family protein [Pseudonocardia sp.]|uniref:copper resistance D family protein n=1 Tax=Pseudonocardia sp. TaxID=60912 RepID=UPI003D0C1676
MTRATAPRPTGERWVPAGWFLLTLVTAVVASVAAGALAGTDVWVLLGTASSRAGMTAVGVACVGLSLVGVLLPGGRESAVLRARADRAVLVAAGVWVALVLVGIAFRAADAYGVAVTELAAPQLLRWSTQLAAGRGMLLAACCALVVAGCVAVRLRDPERVSARAPLVAALLGVLMPAVTGHASASPDHQVAVIAIALHAGAAALWVGGLGAVLVLVAARRQLLAAVLPRYSALAGACLVAVAVTGVVSAAVRLTSWTDLWTTGYGALVLAKAAGLLVAAAFGSVARRRLTAGRAPVLRWAPVEVAVMAATLGLAAALTQAA